MHEILHMTNIQSSKRTINYTFVGTVRLTQAYLEQWVHQQATCVVAMVARDATIDTVTNLKGTTCGC